MANTFELLLKIINQASNRKLRLIKDLNDLPSVLMSIQKQFCK
jgi:hypothetical protein